MAGNDYHLKAILLDIDNTLIDTSKFSATARDCAIDSLIIGGLREEREKITSKFKEIVEKYGPNYSSHFDILLEELKVPREKRNRLITYAVIAYHNAKQILSPFPDVPSTLTLLKEQGYSLYAVSEGLSKKQWEKIIRSNLDRIIDNAFMTEDLSFESKVPEFYSAVLKEIKSKPYDCVMVGDRMEKDIIPAKICGINTVQVLNGRYGNGSNGNTACLSEPNGCSIHKLSDLPGVLTEIEKKVFEEHYRTQKESD